MNITLLANKDLASNFAINLLLPQLSEHKVSIFLSAKVGGNSQDTPAALQQLKYYEQEFALQKISACSGAKFKNFAQLSLFTAQPILELNKINQAHELEILKQTQPDLIISIRYGVILKDAAIATSKYGVINLHSGMLPDYRGVMASFWGLLKQEKQLSTTLHYIENSSIDTGKVIANSNLAVDCRKSYLWHVLNLYIGGTKLIKLAIDDIENKGSCFCVEQALGGDYFTFPTSTQLTEFSRKGLKLVDEDELTEFINQYYL